LETSKEKCWRPIWGTCRKKKKGEPTYPGGEKLGYRIDVVGNGLEALAATRRIREVISAERRPWIVPMTASAMESDRQACIAAVMDDHTPKPVTMESLEAALTRAWRSQGARTDLRSP
jgi:DNA-binding response OmpR family regulator